MDSQTEAEGTGKDKEKKWTSLEKLILTGPSLKVDSSIKQELGNRLPLGLAIQEHGP